MQKKGLFILFISSLIIPSSFYYVSIRNSEKKNKEKNKYLLYSLIWGIIPSVLLSFVTNMFFYKKIEKKYSENISNFLTSVVIAPIFEEIYKILGIILTISKIDEIEDGIIYGSMIGLGFAISENIFYSVEYAENLEQKISLTLVRQITSTIIHITSSGILGLGISMFKRKKIKLLYYFYKGIIKHAGHNFIASIPELITVIKPKTDISESMIYKNIFSPIFIIYLIISRIMFFKNHIQLITKYDKEA